MAEHNELGALGEELACRYLAGMDYRLLERNWRVGHLEVDIIADHYGEIVFVEVKTRRHETDTHTALGAVDMEKKRNLVDAAKAFMAVKHLDAPYRFDIITVVGETYPFEINHYRNAYSPKAVRHKHRIVS